MGLKSFICERRSVGGLKFRGVTTMSTCIFFVVVNLGFLHSEVFTFGGY